MGNHVLRVILISSLLLLAGPAGAQTFGPSDAVETVGSGTVNWTTGEVYATGLGAPPAMSANMAQARAMAERAAQVVAIRNLLETVKGVRVDSETVVENFLVKSDVIKTRVEGIVKGARIVKMQHMSDGSVEVLVAMPMKGAFLNALVPEKFGSSVPLPSLKPAPQLPVVPEKKMEPAKPEPARPMHPSLPEKKAEPAKPEPTTPSPPPVVQKQAEPALPEPAPLPPVPPAQKAEPTIAFKGGTATGLIIDGRGLGLRPALLPRIVDSRGEEVYVGQVVTRTNAVEQGVAGYAKDVNAAANNFRVTDNPAVIKGMQATGSARTDVVIAQADAGALRDLGRKGDFLQNCRVIIVY
jgi:hypothetical protein